MCRLKNATTRNSIPDSQLMTGSMSILPLSASMQSCTPFDIFSISMAGQLENSRYTGPSIVISRFSAAYKEVLTAPRNLLRSMVTPAKMSIANATMIMTISARSALKEPLINSKKPVIASAARQFTAVISITYRLPRHFVPRKDDTSETQSVLPTTEL